MWEETALFFAVLSVGKMMKKILLPTDFSDKSRHAIRYAIRMFGTSDVQYILLNAYALPTTSSGLLISLTDILRLESEEALEQERDQLLNFYPNLEGNLRWRAENAFLETTINSVVEEEKADIIIMGTSGATGIRKILWGSTTAAVMRKVNAPVMVVPDKAKISLPRHLVFAIDKEVLSDFDMPPILRELLGRLKAQLSLINVKLSSEEEGFLSDGESATSRSIVEQTGLKLCSLHGKSAVDAISRYVSENPSDMLVMIARRYGFLKNIFHQSTTREMARISNIPLLVLREQHLKEKDSQL